MQYRLGIDVGNTNTDCVLLGADGRLVAKVKQSVTADIATSIRQAVAAVLDRSGIPAAEVAYAMLGTTQVTNAILERRRLASVGLLRIGAPATQAVDPLAGWPEDLRQVVLRRSATVQGGHEYDGRQISPLDRDAIRRFIEDARAEISSLAVVSVFSPVSAEHELWVRQLAQSIDPALPVSLSHELGSIGFLERESATVLNAAVAQAARRATLAFAEALRSAGIGARTYLSQNDGTLMSSEYALRYPIFTVACGPTNSMRGAAFLSGVEDAVVVDVGGTSTDIGALRGGFPLESSAAVEFGGIRTNFRMPDLVSLALGGGSRVRVDPEGVKVGPDSVGYDLDRAARIFGGDTLTLSDVAVAEGACRIGHQAPLVDPALSRSAYGLFVHAVEEGIERMRISPEPLPLVFVGGGSVLLPDALGGASQVLRPKHFDVANAIGAAMAEVSGRSDRVYSFSGRGREAVLSEAVAAAEADAIRAGADPEGLEVREIEEIPMAYLSSDSVRVRAVVAGHLRRDPA